MLRACRSGTLCIRGVRQKSRDKQKLLGKLICACWILSPLAPFPQVNDTVCDQMTLLTEPLATMIAQKWPFACVDPHVAAHVALLAKLLVTLAAHVGFLTSVGPKVLVKRTLVSKAFGANFARKRFFSCVNS